ncbi:MAG: hypothetical protein JXR37_06985 [Kiritimatiellae bacterium]|nr:hypothetical protein [Kiritimatiellia bacterium]
MRKLSVAVAVVTGVLLAGGAYADRFGVTGKVGTLGWGGDVTLGLRPKLNLRGGFNILNYDIPTDEGDGENADEISAELKWQSFAVLLDWHPSETGFRVTGGLIFNNNRIDMTADPNDRVDINDVEYLITEASGDITFNAVAPYLGMGYGDAAGSKGWRFAFDVGVMLQGSPDVSVQAVAADPSMQAALDADVEEEVSELEDDYAWFMLYPVITFGVSYTF